MEEAFFGVMRVGGVAFEVLKGIRRSVVVAGIERQLRQGRHRQPVRLLPETAAAQVPGQGLSDVVTLRRPSSANVQGKGS